MLQLFTAKVRELTHSLSTLSSKQNKVLKQAGEQHLATSMYNTTKEKKTMNLTHQGTLLFINQQDQEGNLEKVFPACNYILRNKVKI